MDNRIGLPKTDYVSYIYALTILAGGAMGYAKTGSMPSLGAGVLFGGAAALGEPHIFSIFYNGDKKLNWFGLKGAWQISQNPKNSTLAILTSGALLSVMGLRFYKTGKLMPAGLIAGLSFLQSGRLCYNRFS